MNKNIGQMVNFPSNLPHTFLKKVFARALLKSKSESSERNYDLRRRNYIGLGWFYAGPLS